jgi:uncharacterized Zn-finger protein
MASKSKHVECNACEAVFTIKANLDKDYYKVSHCPYCGADLDNEEFEIEENDDE